MHALDTPPTHATWCSRRHPASDGTAACYGRSHHAGGATIAIVSGSIAFADTPAPMTKHQARALSKTLADLADMLR